MNAVRPTKKEEVPCQLCGKMTIYLGTKRCDPCWALETQIKGNPELAAQILQRLSAERMIYAGQRPFVPHDRDEVFALLPRSAVRRIKTSELRRAYAAAEFPESATRTLELIPQAWTFYRLVIRGRGEEARKHARPCIFLTNGVRECHFVPPAFWRPGDEPAV